MRPAHALAFAIALLVACKAGGDEGTSQESAATDPNAACGAPNTLPDDLACTGLYADFGAKVVAPNARSFAPAVTLFSDDAEKQRWILLPDGQKIDRTKEDDWRFPVGTKAWKEFKVGGRLVETRFLWKVRDDKWLQAAYVWASDGTRAVRGEGTDVDLGGRMYHVPKTTQCNDCHEGRKDRLLGFEEIALSLKGATGVTIGTLAAEGRLSPPPPAGELAIPDDGTGKAPAALAYLHMNCGVSCHNSGSLANAKMTGMRLRLAAADVRGGRTPAAWDSLATTIGVPAKTPEWKDLPRIVAGNPDESLIVKLYEMGGDGKMPPLGATGFDRAAATAIREWIAAMPAAPKIDPPPDPPADPDAGAPLRDAGSD
jgi:hypothetical protein